MRACRSVASWSRFPIGELLARPAVAGLVALPSSIGLARYAVVGGVGRAVRPVLAAESALIILVRGGAAGALTWRAWSLLDLARLVNGGLGLRAPMYRPARASVRLARGRQYGQTWPGFSG